MEEPTETFICAPSSNNENNITDQRNILKPNDKLGSSNSKHDGTIIAVEFSRDITENKVEVSMCLIIYIYIYIYIKKLIIDGSS